MPRTRGIVDDHILNARCLRDQWVSQIGQSVKVTRVVTQTTDFYGETDATTTEIFRTEIVFDWSERRRLLEFINHSEEDKVPLRATAKVRDDLPVGSVVTVPMGSPDNINEDSHEWIITLNDVVFNGGVHSRQLTLVPKRAVAY